MRASSLSPGHRFVVIGCGSPVSIPWFKSVTNYDMEMYADTSKKVFDSLSLRHGFGAGMGNMTYWELLSGFLWSISRMIWHQPLRAVDMKQLGGVFVVRGANATASVVPVLFSHVDTSPQDYASAEQILAAMKR